MERLTNNLPPASTGDKNGEWWKETRKGKDDLIQRLEIMLMSKYKPSCSERDSTVTIFNISIKVNNVFEKYALPMVTENICGLHLN